MSDIFNEIEDDLRHQQLKAFWQENGSWIIGGVIAAVVLTGGLSYWRQWEYKHNAVATSELVRLETSADPDQLENFATDAGRKHAVAARFAAAGTYLARGERDKAAALYDEISGMFGVDKTYRSLAKLLAVMQRLDTGNAATLKKDLESLQDGPWRYSALELLALLERRQGHTKEAVELLTLLAADPQAPAEARARALSLRDLYTAGTAE